MRRDGRYYAREEEEEVEAMRLEQAIGMTTRWVGRLRSHGAPWATLLAGFVLICTSDDGAHVRFSFLGSGVSDVDSSNVVIVFTDAERSRVFEGRDFRGSPSFPTPHSPAFGIRNPGPLTVEVQVRSESGGSITSARIAVPIEEGWGYDVNLAVGHPDPARRCAGCTNTRAFPLGPAIAAEAGDSLYVLWGGGPSSDSVLR
jgi:hypothetical protein